jgi:putative membrane protein
MWVEEHPSWISIVLRWRGSIMPRIWRRVFAVTVLGLITTALYEGVPALHLTLTPVPFTLIGLPLGIFLGFRNGSSYERFWEGRKLWGALVNTSRTLTRQILTIVRAPDGADETAVEEFRQGTVRMLVAYVHALRLHLRGQAPWVELEPILAPDLVARLREEENVPIAILQELGERFADARRRGWIHEFHVPIFDASLTSLTDIQGGCERIKATPIPFSYTVLMHRIVAIYCVLLPFGLFDTVKWMTPVVVAFVSYAFFGLDSIGEEIEDPFGLDVNDLPLTAISRTIEINLRRRIGDPRPEPHRPVRGVLT